MNDDSSQTADPRTVGLQPTASFPTEEGGNDASDAAPQSVKEATRDQAMKIAAGIKRGTSEAAHSAMEAGDDFMRQQTRKVASRLDQYTDAVSAACERLEGGEDNLLAGPAHRAARQLERASAYLRSHAPGDMVHDLSDFARRQPEIIFGSMFVAGLASVRFLKASARDGHRNDFRDRQTSEFGELVPTSAGFGSEPFSAVAPQRSESSINPAPRE